MKEIPHIIHYCWFGGKPLPEQYKKYVETWKKNFPDYKVMKWDESNFPIDQYSYAKEAIQAGKMAFVSDVARIHALYEYGGLYFDTDVEVLKNFSELLKEQGAVLGTEDEKKTIGTGFMAFVPKHEICSKMLEYYKNNSFADQSSTMSNTQILRCWRMVHIREIYSLICNACSHGRPWLLLILKIFESLSENRKGAFVYRMAKMKRSMLKYGIIL